VGVYTVGVAHRIDTTLFPHRYEMAQWEAGLSNNGECKGYPVLDFDDVQYILDEEDPKNLMVLGRRLEGEERFIGYSYSYEEPWESTTEGPVAPPQGILSPRRNRGKGTRESKFGKLRPDALSLYIAELFITDSERGLGLGELLLAETLQVHSRHPLRSHLYVSSKNVGAVKCYEKFGYRKSAKPSGDLAHDLVMELGSSTASVSDAATRFERLLNEGTLGARKRRCTSSTNSIARCSSRSSVPSPPQLTGAKVLLISHAQDGSPLSDSRASSRATLRSSPQPVMPVCPRPTRSKKVLSLTDGKESSDQGTRKATRAFKLAQEVERPHSPIPLIPQNSSKRSPLLLTEPVLSKEAKPAGRRASVSNTIQGRQCKARQLGSEQAHSRSLRSADHAKSEGRTKAQLQPDKASKYIDLDSDSDSETEHRMARRSKSKNKFMVTLFSDGKLALHIRAPT
jgi:hypothetical protein